MKRFVLCALLAAFAPAVYPAAFIVPPDREMVRRADAIVVATAIRSFSQPFQQTGIETVTLFEVREGIKGFVPSPLEIHEPGGELDDRVSIIPGVPRFADGERVLLFLRRTPNGNWAVAEIALGRFSFLEDRAGQRLLVRDESDVIGWDQNGAAHLEPRRDAERFLDFVRIEARGGTAAEDYEVERYPLVLPAPQGSGLHPKSMAVGALAFSATSYTSEVNGTGSLGARWNTFPSSVAFYTNGASGSAVSSTQAGVNAWTNECASNINYVYPGNDPCIPSCHTTGLAASDGLNTVLFERNLSQYGISAFSCSGSSYSGTLGIGGITSASSQHTAPNGESFFTTREGDVEMNRGVLACTALGSNLNSAVAHELGHTLGFRHSNQTRANNPSVACSSDPSLECSSGAIMNSSVPQGLNAALQAWDQHAASLVYPGGSCAPPPPPPPTTSSPLIRDLDGDTNSDILWRNTVTGENMVWYMKNISGFSSSAPITGTDLKWQLSASADFNGDGRMDLLWHDPVTGVAAIWHMNGTTILNTANVMSTPSNWFIEGSGDFNGDRRPDLIIHDHSTGNTWLWLMNDNVRISAKVVAFNSDPVNWHVAAVGDFNGDGSFDLLWRHNPTGYNSILRMSGTTAVSVVNFPGASPEYDVGACADYNKDGVSDLWWRHRVNGGNSFWFISNFNIASQLATTPLADSRWRAVGPK